MNRTEEIFAASRKQFYIFTDCIKLLIKDYFKDDPMKAITWMRTKNPAFGNLEPIEFFVGFRGKKCLDIIRELLDENKRE